MTSISAGMTSISACCLRCGYLVTGTAPDLDTSLSRLRNNLGNHRRGKRCRWLRAVWETPRAAWGADWPTDVPGNSPNF